MSNERIRCKAEDCEHTILPETAARTGGFCMRCVAKRQQAEREEYISMNRREVDRYAGLTDTVDIIRELHTWRKPDPLISYKPSPYNAIDLYSRLNTDQIDRLTALAIQAKRQGDKHQADAIVRSLAILTDCDLTNLATAWLDLGECWPSVLFRTASAQVRDRLINFLNESHSNQSGAFSVNHALSALAWVGDQEVQKHFAAWEKDPPAWRRDLYVGPGSYAHIGGWELAGVGRRDLVHETCFAISIVAKHTTEGRDRVATFQSLKSSCPWCSRSLVAMLSIETTDPRFQFLGWKGERLDVLTCDVCTCYSEHVFARIGESGIAEWHPVNMRPSFLPSDAAGHDASPWKGVSIELHARAGILAVESGVGVSASQIGGHPCWVQDTAYPCCPDCGRTMKFIAQLDNDDFKYHEGSYYAFLCNECRVTATCYQQT